MCGNSLTSLTGNASRRQAAGSKVFFCNGGDRAFRSKREGEIKARGSKGALTTCYGREGEKPVLKEPGRKARRPVPSWWLLFRLPGAGHWVPRCVGWKGT